MAIFVDRQTRLLVQGITGREGQFHTRQCIEYGTQVVAGVTPARADRPWMMCGIQYGPGSCTGDQGELQHDLVPPAFAASAISEAIDGVLILSSPSPKASLCST